MKTINLLSGVLSAAICVTADAADNALSKNTQRVLFESAGLGSLGDWGGYSINLACFVGSRFVVSEPATVSAVGSHLNRYDGASVFAAIVRLDSATAFPSGSPFAPYETVASSAFPLREAFSSDYVFPLSAQLSPGAYGLIFGKGQFGDPATPGPVLMMMNNEERPGSDQPFQWNGTAWETSRASHIRLVVYGSADPVLQITRSTSQIVFRWPAVFTNCVIETCLGFPSTNSWSVLTNECSIQENHFFVTVRADGNARFYRLAKK